ncbi:MAG: ABC transporter permease [Actinomycetota bacterium]|nr:ABC transporter permease [Actinomycetota bacterium]
MNNLLNAILVEAKKARRSKVSLVTLLAFLLIPLAMTLFMVILKNPEKAKTLGIVSTKAQLLTAGTASWESFLNLLSQSAVGGMVISSFIAAWVFGREYINKTLKDLLALPTSRTTIVVAKFAIITFWSFTFSLLAPLAGIVLGLIIKLPGFSYHLLLGSISRFVVVTLMAILLSWAVALIANIGRSYFPALGFVVFMVFLAQIVQLLGWGEYFPWAIPALYSNVAAPTNLGAVSYVIVVLTGLLGVWGTVLWWRYADHAY